MNKKVLKDAEKSFLKRYPGGFLHPEMVEIGKKHKMEQLEKQAKAGFAKSGFDDPAEVMSEMTRMVSRSTMISMFEKPKFKKMAAMLCKRDRENFAEALYELLHGSEKTGFESLVAELQRRKMAKWTLATVIQTYYRPKKEVLIKPTTTKLIVNKLELDLVYKPQPTWEFYRKYRKTINEIKKSVDNRLSPSNPAFCGFLMTALAD